MYRGVQSAAILLPLLGCQSPTIVKASCKAVGDDRSFKCSVLSDSEMKELRVSADGVTIQPKWNTWESNGASTSQDVIVEAPWSARALELVAVAPWWRSTKTQIAIPFPDFVVRVEKVAAVDPVRRVSVLGPPNCSARLDGQPPFSVDAAPSPSASLYRSRELRLRDLILESNGEDQLASLGRGYVHFACPGVAEKTSQLALEWRDVSVEEMLGSAGPKEWAQPLRKRSGDAVPAVIVSHAWLHNRGRTSQLVGRNLSVLDPSARVRDAEIIAYETAGVLETPCGPYRRLDDNGMPVGKTVSVSRRRRYLDVDLREARTYKNLGYKRFLGPEPRGCEVVETSTEVDSLSGPSNDVVTAWIRQTSRSAARALQGQ